MKRIRHFAQQEWIIPLLLAALCFFSFGIIIPSLGFYWDDWAKILVARLQGLSAYWQYYVGDRPLSAWTHVFLTPILGVKPASWQIFTLSMRFLSAWGIYILLLQLRPKQPLLAGIAASIFAVYPLFGQQAIAVTFHQQWMQYALIIGSFNLMLLAIRDKKRTFLWTALALLISIIQLTITEYFAPLELLRPFLLWFMLPDYSMRKQKILATLKKWSPYLILLAAFFIIRVFIMSFGDGDPYRTDTLFNFFTQPGETVSWLIRTLIVDLSYIFMGSWSAVFQTQLGYPLSLSYLLILIGSLVIGAGSAFVFWKCSPEDGEKSNPDNWSSMAIVIGLAGTLIGPIPAWITQRQVFFDFHSDRYALAAILGLSILIAGVINWLGRSGAQKAVMAGLIITLGCGYQLRTANQFRGVWDHQLRLYWQLFWRAPQLKAPTAIYSENELIPDQGLFSMSGAINQLYPQLDENTLMDYWFYTLLPKYSTGAPSSINISNDSTFRTMRFIGGSPNTLLIHQDPSHGNCLWILRAEDKDNPYLSDLVKGMLPMSNLSRIVPEAAKGYPPVDLFGSEPAHDWCYSYEKAELAWQTEDWPTITRLGDNVLADGNSPIKGVSNSPREWWPFIVGYAHDGQVRQAIELSQQSIKQDKKYHNAICNLWTTMQDVPQVGVGISELGCQQ